MAAKGREQGAGGWGRGLGDVEADVSSYAGGAILRRLMKTSVTQTTGRVGRRGTDTDTLEMLLSLV